MVLVNLQDQLILEYSQQTTTLQISKAKYKKATTGAATKHIKSLPANGIFPVVTPPPIHPCRCASLFALPSKLPAEEQPTPVLSSMPRGYSYL